MQLQPTEQFTISRQLADPDDADTNYVQATVRNAKTDVLLKRVNLSLKGSQRFTGVYEIPEDVSGEGFYITITTLVYTDAGYSTRNLNYNAEQNTYLVQDRPNRLRNGGGSDFDYKKLAQIINDAVQADEKGPEGEDGKVLLALQEIMGKLDIIEKKELKVEPADQTPVLIALEALHATIKALPEQITKVDLKPLQESLGHLTDAIGFSFQKYDQLAADINHEVGNAIYALSRETGRLRKPKKPAPIPQAPKKSMAENLLEPIPSPFNFKKPSK